MLRPHALAFLLLVTIASCAQTPRQRTGTVTGHVIYADTQQPARLAHVVLQPVVDRRSATLEKDNDSHSEGTFHLQAVSLDGSFTIANVPEGTYYVIVEQVGYVSPLDMFSREQLNDPDEAMKHRIARYLTPVSVTAGHITQAEVRLIRGAAITGEARFEDGSPAINVNVTLLKRDDHGAWVEARIGTLAGHDTRYTDVNGEYHFAGLPSGEYLVRVSVELDDVIVNHIFDRQGSTAFGDGYNLRIFPGDVFRTKDAKAIKVEEGDRVSGIDIDIPVSKFRTITGVVQRPDTGAPVGAAHLVLRFADDQTEIASADVKANDGSFRFDFVPDGTYTLEATKVADVARTEEPTCNGCIPPTYTKTKVVTMYGNASTPIVLTGDLTNVVLQAGAKTTP